MNMVDLTDFAVAILAGGQSSRMNQDKALMPFLGQPLIARQVERLRPLGCEILVITNRPHDYRFLNLPCYPDLIAGAGLLGGLYTALQSATVPFLAVVACDMPFLSPRLLRAQRDLLIAPAANAVTGDIVPDVAVGPDVVIPRSPDGLEPLHLVLRRAESLPAVDRAIRAGQRRMISWMPDVRVREMTEAEIAACDPGFYSFVNINTPEDFSQAEQLAQRLDPGG
jgi:molybdopterin-guanine dinucleotide biosynthesis protein A